MGIIGTALAAASGFQLTRLSVEATHYEVVTKLGDIEIRRYAPRIVAETNMEGSGRDAESAGFRVLAGYIFGKNEGTSKVAMTTPVETRTTGTKIAMTTPVTRARAGQQRTMAFTMPSEHTLESLPTPLDSRVRLREVPGEVVAALRFSGRADEADASEKSRELLDQLEGLPWVASGEPTFAQYDPPWVVGPIRRNEVLVAVRPR